MNFQKYVWYLQNTYIISVFQSVLFLKNVRKTNLFTQSVLLLCWMLIKINILINILTFLTVYFDAHFYTIQTFLTTK